MKIIGHGSTSTVFWNPIQGHATKRFQCKKAFNSELSTWNSILLPHPNIIAFKGAQEDCLEIHLEYVDGDSLEKILSALNGTSLQPNEIWHLLDCLEAALKHLHAIGLEHGDVKPGNVLWDSKRGIWKLCDLGGAGKAATSGTLLYMSPSRLFPGVCVDDELEKVVNRHEIRSLGANDWWSLGIVALEAYFGRHPVHFIEMGDDAVEYFALVFEPESLLKHVKPVRLAMRIRGLFSRSVIAEA